MTPEERKLWEQSANLVFVQWRVAAKKAKEAETGAIRHAWQSIADSLQRLLEGYGDYGQTLVWKEEQP